MDRSFARAAVLTVGTIVAVAASKAGDILQDLKTGYLVGATPARQQFGQLIGARSRAGPLRARSFCSGGYKFGSAEVPAPQATLMKTVIEGVLAGDLPWDLVLTGRGTVGRGDAVRRLGAGLRHRRLPSAGDDGGNLPRRMCPRASANAPRLKALLRQKSMPASSPRQAWSQARDSQACWWLVSSPRKSYRDRCRRASTVSPANWRSWACWLS